MKKKILLSALATSLLLPATTNLVFPTQVTVAQENSIKTFEILSSEITEFSDNNNTLRIVVKAYNAEGKPAGGIVYGFNILEVIKSQKEYKVKADNGNIIIVKIVDKLSTKPTPETTPDSKPETTPDSKPEITPESKPETKPETTPETKPEIKPEVKLDANPAESTNSGTSKNKLTGIIVKKELPKTSAVK